MNRKLFLYFLCAATMIGCSSKKPVALPGRTSENQVLLPNGWRLSPAGTQIDVGDLPLNLDISPDGKYAIVTNNGNGDQEVSIIDLNKPGVVAKLPLACSWLGIRFFDNGSRFVVSGGNEDKLFLYSLIQGTAALTDSIIIGKPWPDEKIWLSGLDVDEATGILYVVGQWNNSCYVIDLHAKKVLRRIALPSKPYTCLVSRFTPSLYVSSWGSAAVLVLDKRSGEILRQIPVGDHPTDMVESPDGKRLFVATANLNTVSAVDLQSNSVTETIYAALYPDMMEGSTPDALALSPDGKRLYIANADNNFLAVMDVSEPGKSRSLGFIPTGWYPTCVRYRASAHQLIVANGKGSISKPNPKGPNPYIRNEKEEYIGSLLKGTLSIINDPGTDELASYTKRAYENTPIPHDSSRIPDAPNAVPSTSNMASPIKHIFYFIKENRTYDQVFGDLKEGNGDSSLCLFGESVTPNLHALARQFVLLDNFYCDAEVSADGHNWSMGAYATDYVEKTWPTQYSGRGGEYEYEGGVPIVYPSAGYIWDNCARHGVTYRSYGEFAANGRTLTDEDSALTKSLDGHIAPHYRSWDLDVSDLVRVQQWMKEFDEYDRSGGLPQFQIIKLPNDHTYGSRSGELTPKAYVAQNDYALGLIVDRITHSSYWKESAIFSIEDDAQNGPDHVDAHRTEALVISPYTKHRFVDHEMYSTSSMVETMELILGLPSLSEYDASAMPMYSSFTARADTSTYSARKPLMNLQERNNPKAFGERMSRMMNFTDEDLAPERELNEIVWKSVRGTSSRMPAPVHSAFVRVADRK
ncbi:MAG TPA: bifunctional YncE family protein/alkaline phosphatase family protein [Bacteroidota bacterium]|nr:bifunctional YncE family protein/alkaline phosphatase family protein [Bacteroidota bacterium]